MKVDSSSFKSQFGLGKLLVETILIVLILLGPIIMITTNNIDGQQIRRIQLLIGKISSADKSIMDTYFKLNPTKINDGDIHILLNIVKNST